MILLSLHQSSVWILLVNVERTLPMTSVSVPELWLWFWDHLPPPSLLPLTIYSAALSPPLGVFSGVCVNLRCCLKCPRLSWPNCWKKHSKVPSWGPKRTLKCPHGWQNTEPASWEVRACCMCLSFLFAPALQKVWACHLWYQQWYWYINVLEWSTPQGALWWPYRHKNTGLIHFLLRQNLVAECIHVYLKLEASNWGLKWQ